MDSLIGHKTADGRKLEYEASFLTHKEAFIEVIKVLTSEKTKVIGDVNEIAAMGHRVLNGREKYKGSTLITWQVIDDIEAFSELSPLRNPRQALTKRACRAVMGDVMPMVAVFNTLFH